MKITLNELNLLIDWWEFFELKGKPRESDKEFAQKLRDYDVRIAKKRKLKVVE
jgi:hypothetical protein